MIEFVVGPNGEKISEKQKASITSMLSPKSFAWNVNEIYNNVNHFSSHQSYDTNVFLDEIKYIVNHKHHTLKVMGGVHTDPYGHTTGMIGQYSPYNEFFPALTKDTYIRFKIQQDERYMKMLRALDTFSVFHYLVDVPEIIQLRLHHTTPVVMAPIIAEPYVPKSRYVTTHFVYG